MTTQRIGKYACLEAERRYLLQDLPVDINWNEGGWRITDCYFPLTRLRLRQMQSLQGAETVYKLTQKYRTASQASAETTITNLYLSETEYSLLRPLGGAVLQKKRIPYHIREHSYSIDIFEGRHFGLLLAEVEYEPGLGEPPLPAFAVKDVTDDPRYSGGSLALMTDDAFGELIAP